MKIGSIQFIGKHGFWQQLIQLSFKRKGRKIRSQYFEKIILQKVVLIIFFLSYQFLSNFSNGILTELLKILNM